jgi:hypothetical protein
MSHPRWVCLLSSQTVGGGTHSVTARTQAVSNFLGARLYLAAVYSELGREAEAQAEADEVLRLNLNFSLEVHKQRAPTKDPATVEPRLATLRKAGLR